MPTVSTTPATYGAQDLIQPTANPTYDPNWQPTMINSSALTSVDSTTGLPTDPNAQVSVSWAPYNASTGFQAYYPGGQVTAATLPNNGQGWSGNETMSQLWQQETYGGLVPSQDPSQQSSQTTQSTQSTDLGPFADDQQQSRRNNLVTAVQPYYQDIYAGGSGGPGG